MKRWKRMIQYTSTYCTSHHIHTGYVVLVAVALDAIFETYKRKSSLWLCMYMYIISLIQLMTHWFSFMLNYLSLPSSSVHHVRSDHFSHCTKSWVSSQEFLYTFPHAQGPASRNSGEPEICHCAAINIVCCSHDKSRTSLAKWQDFEIPQTIMLHREMFWLAIEAQQRLAGY